MNNILLGRSKTPLQFKVFHTLVGFSIFFSLITLPAESQIVHLFGLNISSSFLWWPGMFFCLYLIHTIYGFPYLRHTIYLVILFRVIYVLFLKLAIYLPSSSFWKMQETYTHVLGRDFSYIVKSSLIIWCCSLPLAKNSLFIKNKNLNPLLFLFALIILFIMDNYFVNSNKNESINSLVIPCFIYGILIIFSKNFIKIIEDIELIDNKNKEGYQLVKFGLPSNKQNLNNIFKYHHILFCSSIVFFIASKTMASKFISIGFFTINVGGIVFSLAYLTSDIMTDVYGIERTKQMTLFIIFSNLLFVFDIWITNLLAINDHGEFRSILHNQTRMFFSSCIAFYLGMTINSTMISILKAKQRKKGVSLKKEFITTVWTRVATSSAFGIILDVSLFSLAAFYNIVPNEKLISIIIFEDLYKISYEILLAPLSVLLIYLLKIKEKIDIYDEASNLNPFKINTNYKFNANKFHETYSDREDAKLQSKLPKEDI